MGRFGRREGEMPTDGTTEMTAEAGGEGEQAAVVVAEVPLDYLAACADAVCQAVTDGTLDAALGDALVAAGVLGQLEDGSYDCADLEAALGSTDEAPAVEATVEEVVAAVEGGDAGAAAAA